MIKKFNALPEKARHILTISLIGFIVCLPALISHFPDTQDTIFAYMAFRSFSSQFFQGEIYPRWLFDFYNGYGAPMFYYYPPLPFYFETFLDFITFRMLPGLLILGITGTTLIIGSGLACYAWLKNLFDGKRAVLPAIIYMLLPNHLAIDFYLKGTLTELSTYLWMPLLFLFIQKSFYRPNAWIVVALLYAAFITSTVPLAVAFTPLLLFYIGFECYNHYLKREKFEAYYLSSLGGLVLGFCLAGFHIITAYLLTDFINPEKFWIDFFDPKKWFMCFFDCTESPGEPLSLMFSWLHGLQMVTIACMFLFCWKNYKDSRLESGFWFIMGAGATFMMTNFSWYLWEYLPLLERIQFPFRLAIALDIVIVYFLAKMFPFANVKMKMTETLAILAIFGFTILCLRHTYQYYNRSSLYEEGVADEHLDKRDYFGVYIPPYTEVIRPDLIDEPNIDTPIWTENEDGSRRVIEHKDIPYGRKFTIESEEPITIRIRQLYYPSWQAYSEESGEFYQLSVTEPMGDISLAYPGGSDTIILNHKIMWQQKVGWAFTLFSFVFLAGGYFRNRSKKTNQA